MEGEVIEGFICPICYKDLKIASSLFNHVKSHSDSDPNLLKSVKGLIEKAKQKIQVNSSFQSGSSSDRKPAAEPVAPRTVPGYSASEPAPLNTVICRSHSAKFHAIRNVRTDYYVSQSNVLLIRLSKLLQQLPSDPAKRKAFEQNIVSWVDDAAVPLCPACAQPFNLLKRKHHCRLCGSVMCRNCTYLLSLDSAQKMVGTTTNNSSFSNNIVSSPSSLEPVKKAMLGLDSTKDDGFRICKHCNQFLSLREASRGQKNERTILVQFYERLRESMSSCDATLAQYLKIYNSLCAGETIYTLTEAQTNRIQLLRIADTIDSTSQKIAVLGQNSDNPPEGIHLKLQQTIRYAVTLYLKKNVVSLPSLPTEEDIEKYQTLRRQEIERRLEQERLKEMEEEKLNRSADDTFPSMSSSRSYAERASPGQITIDDGWTPRVKQAIITDDPLLEQIGILHGFIDQAKLAGRMDECEALRQNLKELEEAYTSRPSDATNAV